MVSSLFPCPPAVSDTNLSAGLVLVIRADVAGVGEQGAGEGRGLLVLGALPQAQGGTLPAAVHKHWAAGRRRVPENGTARQHTWTTHKEGRRDGSQGWAQRVQTQRFPL